jgi:rubrerythrin
MQDGPDYIAGIRQAYIGELAASRLYRALADRRDDSAESAKLAAIADVESRTAGVLEPVIRRLGITCDMAEMDDIVQRRVEELGPLSWSQFIEQALEAWPPYVEQFAALSERAPPTDAPALKWLVAHERALIEFLHIERLAPHTRASLVPLEAYLASAR